MKKLIETFCCTVLLIALSQAAAFGQIKIPNIFKPKPNQPNQPTPNADSILKPNEKPLAANAARKTVTNKMDDGYTWFEAKGFDASEGGKRVDKGWALVSSVRLLGEFPDRSAFRIVVSKAGKPVATTRCPTYSNRFPADSPSISFMWAIECFNKETAIKEIGKFDVEIFAINGETDAETLARTYKIEVFRAERVAGPTTKPYADVPNYYISRHAEAPVSFLFMRPKNMHSYTGFGNRSETTNINRVEIYYNLSPTDEGKGVPSGYLRCAVDGKRLQFPGPQPYADQAAGQTDRRYEAIYTDRLAAQYKTGTEYREPIGFMNIRLVLPLTWGGERNINRLNMEDFPGNWECSLMNNGEIWRTWRWRVGRGGMPEMHAEQIGGNINLNYYTYLLDTEIPPNGTILDKRLAPVAAVEGSFYGQKWTTPEGKAMAAKVPTKGNLHPVASNKIK